MCVVHRPVGHSLLRRCCSLMGPFTPDGESLTRGKRRFLFGPVSSTPMSFPGLFTGNRVFRSVREGSRSLDTKGRIPVWKTWEPVVVVPSPWW